jgi:hypothetical protein
MGYLEEPTLTLRDGPSVLLRMRKGENLMPRRPLSEAVSKHEAEIPSSLVFEQGRR